MLEGPVRNSSAEKSVHLRITIKTIVMSQKGRSGDGADERSYTQLDENILDVFHKDSPDEV